jgi:MFS transporter, DHA2 family, multidrug resistance protein
MTLSVGGIAALLCMPIVGVIIAKVDARYLLALGFLICGVSLLMFAGINLNVTAEYLTGIRCFQALCFGLIFIPVQTLAYVGVPMELNNDV